MIPKELDDLIKEYLTDGIISAKERQVLLKKAEQLGLDRDEFDLYIDAQQQKADMAVDAATARKRGKTCPFCGGTVPQLTDKCPHCGETITAEASEELQEIFDNLEEALVDFKSGKDIAKSKATVERYVRKAKMYYENNPKVQKLLADVQDESEKAEKSAKNSARNEMIGKAAGGIGGFLLGILKTKVFLWCAIIAVCLFGLAKCYRMCYPDTSEQEKQEQVEKEAKDAEGLKIYKADIDAQYEERMAEVKDLPAVTKSNYKDVESKLLKITWSTVAPGDLQYEEDKKQDYLEAKRAIAEQIYKCYPEDAENVPDQIRFSSMDMKN